MGRRFRRYLLSCCALAAALALSAPGSALADPPSAPYGDQSLIGLWRTQNSQTVAELNGIFFKDSRNGFLVGGEGSNGRSVGTAVVRHTTDGGVTWLEDAGARNAENVAANHELKKVFIVGQEVWIIGEDTDENFLNGSGGCNFDSPGSTPSDQQIIMHSPDGGVTWARQSSNTCLDLESIYMFDSTHGIIGVDPPNTATNAPSENSYLQTSDGGNTWTFRTMAAAGAGGCVLADSIFFPPSNLPFNQREGWAADNCILHTVDGGQTWTEQRVNGVLHGESSYPASPWEHVYGPSPSALLAVRDNAQAGPGGGGPDSDNVAKFDPAAGLWHTQSVSGTDRAGLHAITFVDGKFFLFGESGGEEAPTMFVSTDLNGNLWNEITPLGGSGEAQSASSFTLDSTHAWVVGQQGSVIAYRNEPGAPAPPSFRPGPPACSLTLATTNPVAVTTRSGRAGLAQAPPRGMFSVTIQCTQNATVVLHGTLAQVRRRHRRARRASATRTRTFALPSITQAVTANTPTVVPLQLPGPAVRGLRRRARTTAALQLAASNPNGNANATANLAIKRLKRR